MTNLKIANGRLGVDKNIGKFTCQDWIIQISPVVVLQKIKVPIHMVESG